MAARDTYSSGFDEAVQDDATTACPECGGYVRMNSYETVCEECGLVLDDQPLDRGPEWRPFEADERRRTGPPRTKTRHDDGLSTRIGRKTDANGTELPSGKRRRMHRLRREHSRGRWESKADRNLGHGLAEVRRIAGALEMADSLTEQACQLFRTAQNADLLPGRSIEAFAAASVAATCRVNSLSRTISDVAEHAAVSTDRVENAYSVLNTELELPTRPPTPAAFVPRLAAALDVSDHVRRQAEWLAERAQEEGLSVGKRPQGFAAACVYLASQQRGRELTQTRVAEVADTSPVTIRRTSDTLCNQNKSVD